jgi:hypothetical protein
MKEAQEYQIVFFGGGETRDDLFNVFTGSFIRFLSLIFKNNFKLIKGIYYRFPVLNVIWALNNAQKPIKNPEKNRILSAAFKQIVDRTRNKETILIIISSSSGSIVAAQAACYLARESMLNKSLIRPFHLVMGTSIISKKSDLFLKLLEYQKTGIIGTIIFDELNDEEDSINGTGGRSRIEAYRNAFGLMFPFLSTRFKGPSFLNTDHEKGHIHRRRSQTVKKAVDFIEVIFIRNKLAGDNYREKAAWILNCEK